MTGFRKVLIFVLGLLAIVLPTLIGTALAAYAVGGVVTITLAALGANVVTKWIGKDSSAETTSAGGDS